MTDRPANTDKTKLTAAAAVGAAATLGIPLGTAKSRLHRAIGSLRRAFEPDAPESELEGGRLA